MTFENLCIYKLSLNLAENIYDLTSKFPKSETYGLTNQIKRASVSIFSNIVEGFGKRTNKDFRNFLYNSRGSLNEVKAQIIFANRRNYISDIELNSTILEVDILGKKLASFIRNMSV